MSKQNLQIIFIAGGTLTIVGAVAQLFNVKISPYIFSTGALLLIVLQLLTALDSKNNDKRLQRLTRVNFITSLFLALAAYFMFTSSNSWVVAVLIYALSSLIMSFRAK